MKKIFSIVLLIISMLMTACGGNKTQEVQELSTEVLPKDTVAELRIWSWDVAAKGLRDTVESFNKIYPNVKVIVEEVGTGDTYQKLTIGLNSNTGLPDIVTVETDAFVKYPPNFPNGFVDLTPVAGNLREDFDPSKWELGSFEGHILALPWDSAPGAMFYRRDMFAKAGIDPQSIVTWDDFIEAGKAVQAANPEVKMFPINYAKGAYVHNMIMNSQGSGTFNEKGEIIVGNEESLRSFNLQKKMLDEGLTYNADSWNTLVIATKNSEVATVAYGGWWGGTLKDQMPEQSGKWGVIPFPAFTEGQNTANYVGGASLAIPSQSKNHQLAWEFIKNALVNKENQVMMYKKYDLFPAYLPSFKDEYFELGDPYFAGQKVGRFLSDIVPNINKNYSNEDSSEAGDYVLAAQAAVLTGSKDPKTELEKAAKAISEATGRVIAK
ncbi:ABC transporter substrate-binding protein [Propionigenium maris DSM 9537]|uniref:ABC transporter substrate-binding protein n=1 Tax=Propionigenium maris DSM 9537 TaxID=1123000 RepID=A0A9W6LNJ7_9FUSO|nr:sugar ABC transporter substrate-binding protein [Propionigenium maris]GLI56959.1 ABC transporter substrate-binding protein [Propionigenium maris DSM 9537]